MDIKVFGQQLRTVPNRLKTIVPNTLLSIAVSVRSDLQANSPQDSGYFNTNWKVTPAKATRTYSITIDNHTTYGTYLEYGATPGAYPWISSRTTTSGGISQSGKTKNQDGRVWAGGKSPSGWVIGGITTRVADGKKMQKAAETLANSIMQSI